MGIKRHNLSTWLVCVFFFALYLTCDAQGQPNRGPVNIQDNGIIDGVVIKDEVPIRNKVEYEHVRAADLVWSRRVFSRIDSREKMNHDIFLPYDFITDEKSSGIPWLGPADREGIETDLWIKNAERYSLWTIIMKHIFLGDLKVYEVSDPTSAFMVVEDGYKFKYPILPTQKDESVRDKYFTDSDYKQKINKVLVGGAPGDPWQIEAGNQMYTFKRPSDPSIDYNQYLDNLLANGDSDYGLEGVDFQNDVNNLRGAPKELAKFELRFKATAPSERVLGMPKEKWISSASISAYNIKEDWFFDKERSLLDRRIIAIAPVMRYKSTELKKAKELNEKFDRYQHAIFVQEREVKGTKGVGNLINAQYVPIDAADIPIELEIFWLYFPELRNVLVNYYVYNDQSDAQWMSFDDLFWKRRFTSKIYKVSDKFDREIQDYKYGVDALYEAERLKEKIRNWEINVWNY